MNDDVDGSVGEPPVISRRALIRKGMLAAGAGLWAVPVVAVVARNSGADRQAAGENDIVPADHGGPHPVPSCNVQGSGAGCITFVCGGPLTECVGTPLGGATVCFCDADINGVCRCFANEPCANLEDCPNVGAPNGGCAAGFFCVNSFSCCGVAKCARLCT